MNLAFGAHFIVEIGVFVRQFSPLVGMVHSSPNYPILGRVSHIQSILPSGKLTVRPWQSSGLED